MFGCSFSPVSMLTLDAISGAAAGCCMRRPAFEESLEMGEFRREFVKPVTLPEIEKSFSICLEERRSIELSGFGISNESFELSRCSAGMLHTCVCRAFLGVRNRLLPVSLV